MIYRDIGIILKSRESGEADRIFSIYTKNYGKIEAIAQGVRKAKSKLAGHLLPLVLGEFMFVNGRRKERIIQARLQENFSSLKKDLRLLAQASFMAEAVDLLTKSGESDKRIFELLQTGLEILNQSHFSPNWQEIFVIKLLQFLGFEMRFNQCISCGSSLEASSQVYLNQAYGEVVCPQCRQSGNIYRSFSSLMTKTVREIFGCSLSDLSSLKISPSIQEELKVFVEFYLKTHLEFNLKSKQFLKFFVFNN
jgi:DNA repair protein RecO (recombination protein O)